MENVDFLDLPQKRFKMLTTGTIILASAIRQKVKKWAQRTCTHPEKESSEGNYL